MKSTPKGGFGNRVLNYLAIREIAHFFGVNYFSVNTADRLRIRGIHRPPRIPLRVGRIVTFSSEEVLRSDFRDRIGEALEHSSTVVLKPPLLGEALARWDVAMPRELVSHRMTLCRWHRPLQSARPQVALHFRGTDFEQWNKDAILPASFYHSALDVAVESLSQYSARICTDDPNHPALASVVDRLTSEGRLIEPAQCDDPFGCDFAALAEADIQIASPSTFSIVAGLLGYPQVIHSAMWVDNRIANGELFWQKVSENSFNGYNILAIV